MWKSPAVEGTAGFQTGFVLIPAPLPASYGFGAGH